MKTCKYCQQELPLEEFYKSGRTKDGRLNSCKKCYRERKASQLSSEYKLNSRLKHLYGITLDEYNKWLEFQHGRCAICSRSAEKERLLVDHCHKSKEIRGLLCRNCNTGLGQFRDSPELLLKAISYLD